MLSQRDMLALRYHAKIHMHCVIGNSNSKQQATSCHVAKQQETSWPVGCFSFVPQADDRSERILKKLEQQNCHLNKTLNWQQQANVKMGVHTGSKMTADRQPQISKNGR